jgi:hypothetical protein
MPQFDYDYENLLAGNRELRPRDSDRRKQTGGNTLLFMVRHPPSEDGNPTGLRVEFSTGLEPFIAWRPSRLSGVRVRLFRISIREWKF